MITSLQLENYRGFEHYEINPLGRVNLLVGANNCGKTSIVEAIHFLSADNPLSALGAILWRRGEVVSRIEDSGGRNVRVRRFFEVSHFFHGHKVFPGNSFRIAADNDLGMGSAKILPKGGFSLEDAILLTQPATTTQLPMFEEFSESELNNPIEPSAGLGLEIENHFGKPPVIVLNGANTLSTDTLSVASRSFSPGVPFPVPEVFIPCESLDNEALSSTWDRVLLEGRESDVVRVMRIVEPEVAQIVFLSGRGQMSKGGILVELQDVKQRVPLGSLGDGLRRVLALALALVRSQKGILLIDEIDTGLHYSVMGDMWRVVVEAAIQNNIQVFATTHSHDCVKGLRWLCANHPDLKKEVALHTIDHPRLDKAVTMAGDEIVKAVDLGIEVR